MSTPAPQAIAEEEAIVETPVEETEAAPASAPESTGDESDDEAAGEETTTEAKAEVVATSGKLPGAFAGLIGRIQNAFGNADVAGLKAQLEHTTSALAAEKTLVGQLQSALSEKTDALSAVQAALEKAVAESKTAETQALATVASLGVPEEVLPRATGDAPDEPAASKTPHLDAWEKMPDGPAKTAYFRENRAVLHAENDIRRRQGSGEQVR
jgi:hypothetical protein